MEKTSGRRLLLVKWAFISLRNCGRKIYQKRLQTCRPDSIVRRVFALQAGGQPRFDSCYTLLLYEHSQRSSEMLDWHSL